MQLAKIILSVVNCGLLVAGAIAGFTTQNYGMALVAFSGAVGWWLLHQCENR